MAFDLNLKWNAGNESCFAFEFGKWLLTWIAWIWIGMQCKLFWIWTWQMAFDCKLTVTVSSSNFAVHQSWHQRKRRLKNLFLDIFTSIPAVLKVVSCACVVAALVSILFPTFHPSLGCRWWRQGAGSMALPGPCNVHLVWKEKAKHLGSALWCCSVLHAPFRVDNL